MDLKQIKELIASMDKAKLKRLKLRTEKGFELLLEKEGHDHPHPHHRGHHHGDDHQHPGHPPFPHHAPPLPAPHKQVPEEKPRSEAVEGKYVLSPMVGTYYASPSPDDPPFVKVGDTVSEGTVVCIVEAMKVMNEVKAGVKGKVAEILIDNGHPVEFGTKIIRIV